MLCHPSTLNEPEDDVPGLPGKNVECYVYSKNQVSCDDVFHEGSLSGKEEYDDMKLNDQEYTTLLDEICRDICPNVACFLKFLLIKLHPEPRLMIQLKCIYRYKGGKCDDWNKALWEWIDEKYAEAFLQAYKEAEILYLKKQMPPNFEAIYSRTLELVIENKNQKGLDFKI